MADLTYGVCDCEYPCSCVEYEGKRYGDWKEIIHDQAMRIGMVRGWAQGELSLPPRDAADEGTREAAKHVLDLLASLAPSDGRGDGTD